MSHGTLGIYITIYCYRNIVALEKMHLLCEDGLTWHMSHGTFPNACAFITYSADQSLMLSQHSNKVTGV